MAEEKRTVCVDLDGVLNLYRGWKGEDHFPAPRPGAVDFIHELLGDGYEVVILTTRSLMKTAMWLYQYRFPWRRLEITNVKPPAVAYVDDRAVRFNGTFAEALHGIRNMRPHWEPTEAVRWDQPVDPPPDGEAVELPFPFHVLDDFAEGTELVVQEAHGLEFPDFSSLDIGKLIAANVAETSAPPAPAAQPDGDPG